MLIVLDPCNLSLGAEPGGGITIRISEIEGFEGRTILIPVAKEGAEAFIEGARQIMNHKGKLVTAPATALNDLKRPL